MSRALPVGLAALLVTGSSAVAQTGKTTSPPAPAKAAAASGRPAAPVRRAPPPPRRLDPKKAIAQAARWALGLWKNALAFTKKRAKRTGAALAQATQERDRARAAREKLEKDLTEARQLVNNFAQARADLREREKRARRKLTETKADLDLLTDADGSLQRAIDAAVMRKLPQRMERLASKARKAAALRLLASRDLLVAAAARESAKAAVQIVAADTESLEHLAAVVARELASSDLGGAVRGFNRAVEATAGKKPKRALRPSRDARKALARALPTTARIAAALRRRLRERTRSLAEALLGATWHVRRVPVADEKLPATAAALARHAGTYLAARGALPKQPPDPEDVGKVLDLAPLQRAIQAAAAAARRSLEARRAAWQRALEGLERVAQEVLE